MLLGDGVVHCLEFFHMLYPSWEVILVQNADHYVYFKQECFLSYREESIKGHCLLFIAESPYTLQWVSDSDPILHRLSFSK